MNLVKHPPLIEVPLPRQKRSRDALERILSAGEKLLAENHYEESAIVEITKLADSSVGTFYRILGDKDTLSLLLLQRFIDNLEQVVDSEFQPDSWLNASVAEIATAFAGHFVAVYSGRRGVLRALILRASRDANFRDRIHKLNQSISDHVVACLQPHLDEINHPRSDVAIQSVTHIVLGTLNQHTVTGSLGGIAADELVDELARVFTSYLGAVSA